MDLNNLSISLCGWCQLCCAKQSQKMPPLVLFLHRGRTYACWLSFHILRILSTSLFGWCHLCCATLSQKMPPLVLFFHTGRTYACCLSLRMFRTWPAADFCFSTLKKKAGSPFSRFRTHDICAVLLSYYRLLLQLVHPFHVQAHMQCMF